MPCHSVRISQKSGLCLMAKIPVHFHDDEFFEVQFQKTQAVIRDLSAGKITRDPNAPVFKPEPKPAPAIQPGPTRRERMTHWLKKLHNYCATHPGASLDDARAFYAAMKARAREHQKEAAHGA